MCTYKQAEAYSRMLESLFVAECLCGGIGSDAKRNADEGVRLFLAKTEVLNGRSWEICLR